MSPAKRNAPLGIPQGIWGFKLSLLRFIMGGTMIVFTFLVFVQVVLRYFTTIALFGIEEIAAYLAVWLYFSGSAYGTYQQSHISASLMDFLISGDRNREWVALFVAIMSAIIVAIMLWFCTKYFLWSTTRLPKSPELRMPLYFVHAAMVFGIGLMAFYYLLEIGLRIKALWSGHSYTPMAGQGTAM